MQSQRCAAPPTMSRSTSVTSAPSDAATVAAVLPAGPPPRITNRTAIRSRLRGSGAYPDRSMQQLLVDELTGDRVILAPARALRPDTFRVHADPLPASDAACPFCLGNEHETPPEVARAGSGAPDTPGWTLRVVPNKYPIVGDGVAGAHEVVVFSPAHDAGFGALSEPQAADVLFAAARPRPLSSRAGLSVRTSVRQPGQGRGRVDRASARPARRARSRTPARPGPPRSVRTRSRSPPTRNIE